MNRKDILLRAAFDLLKRWIILSVRQIVTDTASWKTLRPNWDSKTALNRYRWRKNNKVKHIEIKDNVGLRPTDYEIELEARQQSEEQGWTHIQRILWEQGAKWARGISKYSNPNINHIADANKMV